MDSREHRRLAAIFVLDVFGFSRMMAEDESGTLARVLDQRRAVIEPQIADHDGRVVKLMGDGVLAEFPSVTEAVKCAVAIQDAARASGAQGGDGGAPPVLLRIGINLGEVIVEGGDIYGDGVNVAARLEGLAQPGGIALSGAAHEQVRTKLPFDFRPIGPHRVKNIPEPIEVYHLDADAEVAQKSGAGPPRRTGSRRPVLLALVAVVLVAAGLAAWMLSGGDIPVARGTANPLARLDTDHPSVVVLPFNDLSGGGEQTYFSDGITDSLITDLSRVSGLLIIARNTSFAMRDQSRDIRTVGRELGVRYVVTGSVQRAADRLRINARLTDADSGYQIWADRFDSDLDDIFAVQDEVTHRIVAALEVHLSGDEEELIAMPATRSFEAYDKFLQARSASQAARSGTDLVRTRGVAGLGGHDSRADQARAAQAAIEAALALDPDFAQARAQKAMQQLDLSGVSPTATPDVVRAAGALAQSALDDGMALSPLHSVRALAWLFEGDHAAALKAAREALVQDPNYADGYAILAWVYLFAGRTEDADKAMQIALRLNPFAPAFYHTILTEIAFDSGDDGQAIAQADEALILDPEGQRARLVRAVVLARSGQFEAASLDIGEILRREPGLSIRTAAPLFPFQDQTQADRMTAGLRLAGVPE